MDITVRSYRASDAPVLADIYYDTILKVNVRDYSREQVRAWAGLDHRDDAKWARRFEGKKPFVAEVGARIEGFAELEADGHIDCFYCHRELERQGVGSALMREILSAARDRGLDRLYAEVSLTARPFFESLGFEVERDNELVIRGVTLPNFLMELSLLS